jgi:xylulokinase
MRHLMTSIAEAGATAKRYVAVGGGTKGGVWTQIISDVCGMEQDLPRYAVGASYGDALLAAQVAGLADESTNWVQIAATVRPNPANKQRYDDLFGYYLELYPATKDLQHHLAELNNG